MQTRGASERRGGGQGGRRNRANAAATQDDAYAQSKATKCRKYLFSLSINPDLAKYDLSRDQYLDFIARTERSFGLSGQPRAVVFHVKNGREHAHVVWSRIDVNAGKVGRDVAEAIFAPPNNTHRFSDVAPTGVIVQRGPVMDGIGHYLT